jgi:hypothetical protein
MTQSYRDFDKVSQLQVFYLRTGLFCCECWCEDLNGSPTIHGKEAICFDHEVATCIFIKKMK